MPGTPLNVHTSWTMVCNSITILLAQRRGGGVDGGVDGGSAARCSASFRSLRYIVK